MNIWRWRTIAAAVAAGIMVIAVTYVILNVGAANNNSGTDWQLLNIPAEILLMVFILPGIIADVVVVHGIRQEITDRRYDERRRR